MAAASDATIHRLSADLKFFRKQENRILNLAVNTKMAMSEFVVPVSSRAARGKLTHIRWCAAMVIERLPFPTLMARKYPNPASTLLLL
ncbi:hypothetical protein [Sphingomonas xinjiangensis]|uniref:Uncharacterized protein n=1 Tax=Sphingomonas xinjiangensis TaxID=643568 RepID=A0A840YNV4_9SPHN|nr:hypothetical protein [Sphingomonas xinjiangensis]MBB5712076.1 hypothetical protein [Sphingomonas xinjiangensis]